MKVENGQALEVLDLTRNTGQLVRGQDQLRQVHVLPPRLVIFDLSGRKTGSWPNIFFTSSPPGPK